MSSSNNLIKSSPFVKFLFSGLFFVGILCVFRLFFCKPILGWDEAEQVVFAQKLSAGYVAQPPLYNWLQYFIFKLFGTNLFSVVVLKYSLTFFCFYIYHQICCLYCKNKILAWCATLSWCLISSIGIELIHNKTHAVTSLLAACLTWYWLIRPSQLSKILWFFGFGLILGLGFLSKFNYFLFLFLLLFTAMTIKEFRAKLIQKEMLISLFVACLVSAIYGFWLFNHFSEGTYSASKMFLPHKTLADGLLQLLLVSLTYLPPVILLSLFFPFWRERAPLSLENQLLWRYHYFVFPFIVSIVIAAGFHDFRGHWALSLFFLFPLFIVSLISKGENYRKRGIYYLVLCIVLQSFILIGFAINSYKRDNLALDQLISEIKKDKPSGFTLVGSHHWLLGNLMVNFPKLKGFFFQESLLKNQPLPQGKLLVVWQGAEPPNWLPIFTAGRPERKIKELVKNQVVVAGYLYDDLGLAKN